MRRALLAIAGLSLAWSAGQTTAPAPRATQPSGGSAPGSRPAVVAVLPFAIDFTDASGTDEDYGKRVAIAIAHKWSTQRGWEVLDRYTVDDAMAQAKVARGCEVDRKRLAELAQHRLACDALVFGSVSGATASKTIRVCVVDYRRAGGLGDAGGKTALDKTYKMSYWTDLRFILEDAISSVTGSGFAHPSETLAILDPASETAWKTAVNLVPNPDFSAGADGRLAKWEALIEDKRYNPPATDQPTAPLQEDRTKMILWSPAPSSMDILPVSSTGVSPVTSASTGGAPVPPRRVLQFAMPESVAGLNGLACYSDWIEAKVGHRYRCAITYASDGPTFLPFVKGYAQVQSPGENQPQRREVYRRQFPKLPATGGKWQTSVVDLVPSVLEPPPGGHRAAYDLKWIRVDLYCYWPKGHVWVKDVTLKLVESPGKDGTVLDPMAPTSQPAGQ